MALSDADITRIWTHKHPTQWTGTDMRGWPISIFEKLQEMEQQLEHTHALVEQINRVVVLGGTPNP